MESLNFLAMSDETELTPLMNPQPNAWKGRWKFLLYARF